MMTTSCEVQLILLGESGVGKTSLFLRFISGIFKESLARTTIDKSYKIIKIEDKEIQLLVWDTAGQEMYNSLVSSYYRVADGVVLVYDVQNAETFLKLSKWLLDLKSKNEKAQVLIAGNKIEDQSKKRVTVSMVSNFARAEQLEHVGVSAKSGENVEILFHHLVKRILAAKGILSYSQDNLLENLAKTGAYISPWTSIPDQTNSLSELDGRDTVTTSNIPDHEDTQTHLTEDSGTCEASSRLVISEAYSSQEQEDASSQDSDSFVSMTNEDDTDSTDLADCALEYFDSCEILGMDSPEKCVIRLHEESPNMASRQEDIGCCTI